MRGLFHLHVRKRLARGLEPFPASTSFKRLLDRIVLLVGIAAPLMALTQLYKILMLQDAASVSSLFWGACALFNIPWVLYGIVHRERPIVVAYAIWFVVNTTTCLAAIYYGAGLY